MDIFKHIESEHRRIEALMDQVTTGNGHTREELYLEMKEAILQHSRAEEQAFYPDLQHAANDVGGSESDELGEAALEMIDLVAEARSDHTMIEQLLRDLDDQSFGSAEWLMTFNELRETVENHLEMEEGEVFDDARALLGRDGVGRVEQHYDEVERQRSSLSL